MAGNCAHRHLRFEDGTYHLACLDCDQRWVARVTGTSEALDTSLKTKRPEFGRDTRHDRFSFPKLKRPDPPPPTSVPSSGTPRQDRGRKS